MGSLNEKSGAVKRYRPDDAGGPGFAVAQVTDAAVWIENGSQDYMKSMPSQVNGTVIGLNGSNMRVESNVERLSAFVIKGGEEPFTLSDTTIRLSGYGTSDFTSRGAGVLAWDKAKVALNNVDIETFGAGRPATVASEGAVLELRGCRLGTHGGALPQGYVPVIGPGMMEPPFPLGLSGNCRTHLSMSGSETFLYDCDIFAQAWAALSTDSSGGYLYLEANNCRIDVPGNGYVTYADNGCHVCLNDCTATAGNMLAIQDGNSSVELNNVGADCEKIGFLLHGGMPQWQDTGIIEINGGRIHAKNEVFLAKSTNVDIYVKDCALISDSGILFRSMVTDDEFYGRKRTKGPECYGLQMTLENTRLEGEINHGDGERKMNLSLSGATLTGAITGGPNVILADGSFFLAKNDSELKLCCGAGLEAFDAEKGVCIYVAAGDGCAIAPGAYLMPSGGTLKVVL